jgi:hypothetical protein
MVPRSTPLLAAFYTAARSLQEAAPLPTGAFATFACEDGGAPLRDDLPVGALLDALQPPSQRLSVRAALLSDATEVSIASAATVAW